MSIFCQKSRAKLYYILRMDDSYLNLYKFFIAKSSSSLILSRYIMACSNSRF